MKVEHVDEENFYIYINKYCLTNLQLDDKQCVEEYFKKLFMNLKNNHHFDITGYYNIRVYANKQYGLIIDVFKLSNDYFKLPNNKVDMKIVIDSNCVFLYEIEDYFFVLPFLDRVKNTFYNNGKYYLELKENIDNSFYSILMEHSRIVFDEEAQDVLTTGFKL